MRSRHPALLAAAAFVAWALLSVVAVYSVRLSGMEGGVATAVATFVMDAGAIGVACAIMARLGEPPVFGEQPTGKTFAAAVGLLALVWLAGTMASTFVYLLSSDPGSETYVGSMSEMGVLYAVFAVVLAPVAEELVFRGAVFGGLLETRMPPIAAAVLSSAAFAAMHGTAAHIAPTFLLGLLCCWTFMRYGSVLPGMALHSMMNVASLFFAGLPIPEVLAQGEVAAMSVGAVGGLLAVLLLNAQSKRMLAAGEEVADATEDDD